MAGGIDLSVERVAALANLKNHHIKTIQKPNGERTRVSVEGMAGTYGLSASSELAGSTAMCSGQDHALCVWPGGLMGLVPACLRSSVEPATLR